MKWVEPNPDHPRDPRTGEFADTPGVRGLEHVVSALADTPQAKRQTVEDFAQRMRDEYPGMKLAVARGGSGVIVLSSIVVPERSKGVGTKVMRALVELADRLGDTVALTPSSDFGGTKSRLIAFYKRFGFVENKGRNRDFAISETMYREPVKP
jgi:GNAT superfamily N-acetyltransferase